MQYGAGELRPHERFKMLAAFIVRRRFAWVTTLGPTGVVSADKIPRDVNPSEFPVEQATKFELVINRKTAKRSVSPFRPRCSPAPTR